MVKQFRPAFFFFPYFLIFTLLYVFKGQEAPFLAGLTYAAILGLRLKSELPVRALFPLVMLFFFLLGIALSPNRAFTESLIYTTRLLIVFRGLLLLLTELRNKKEKPVKADLAVALAFGFESLSLLALVFSTFKSSSPLFVAAHWASLRFLIVAGLAYTPLWIPALLLAPGLFFPLTFPWVLLTLAALAAGRSLKVEK